MAFFESGVSSYVHAIAKVDVYFPVDHRENSHICCEECFFYRESSRSCSLNHESCTFPSKYVGGACPLVSVTDEQAKEVENLLATIAAKNSEYQSLETE